MSSPGLLTFSVVTPSYKQPDWLRLCAQSVADQGAPGIEIEHIVQDSLSGPEIAEAVQSIPDLKLFSEKDKGMYDAITRGWDKARGDVLTWLNCDEEYLPGALKEVADYFNAHPETELLFADAIVIDPEGAYICSRQTLAPHIYHTWTCHLNTFSCSMFFRRSLLKDRGFALDASWKDLGDTDLILRMLKSGVRMAHLPSYTSTFVDTGENMNLGPQAQKERKTMIAKAPKWVQVLTPIWKIIHRLRRLVHGQYSPKPFSYDIFTKASPTRRVHFEVTKPTFYWAARMK
jgi:glycosyltransferase involved in cell wall biosynthesis